MVYAALRAQCRVSGRVTALSSSASRHVVFKAPMGRIQLRKREESIKEDSKDTLTVRAGDPDRYVDRH